MMKIKRKKSMLFLMLCLFITTLLSGCSSSDEEEPKMMVPIVKQDMFVYDLGNFLDDEAEKKTNTMLIELEEKSSVEFAVITIPTLNGIELEDYAVDLGNELGIGKADKDNGILLLISKEDEKVRLEIGNGLQEIITDSKSGKILDKFFVPHREEDDYDTAVLETVQAVINALAASEEYSGLDIEGINPDLVLKEYPWYYYVIALIILVLIAFFIEWVTGHIFGDGMGDGLISAIVYSGGSSGSSGGSFGGGSFSGGGASR